MLFRSVVRIPYDMQLKQVLANGKKGALNVGAVLILGWSAIEELYTSVAIIYTKFILLCLLCAASFSVLRTRAAAFP